MTPLPYRLGTEADAAYLAPRLRWADYHECSCVVGYKRVQAALEESVRVSEDRCRAYTVNGEVVMLAGVGRVSDEVGSPWLLSSNGFRPYAPRVLADTKAGLEECARGYRSLRNHVHADNAVSIRWLKHLGFTLLPPVPFGLYGEPFHPFFKTI